MENETNEQHLFDNLIKQLNEDFQNHPDLFTISNSSNRMLVEFANNSDATILISNNSRMITVEQSVGDYSIIDADYVENSQEFYNQIKAFEQFYQTEKEATKRYLTSLGKSREPEVTQSPALQQEVFVESPIEAEPYSQAWLKNSENAVWELHWDNGHTKSSEQYISQDLFQTINGEFILHEYRSFNGRESVQRNLSIEEVREFVSNGFQNPEDIFKGMEVEVEETVLAVKGSTTSSIQSQLTSKIENEYESFKDGMMQLSKEDMMSTVNAYETMVKSEIMHYVQEGHIKQELIEVLLKSENVLDDLYQEYTANDSNEFFDHIQSAIDSHVSQSYSNEKEIDSSRFLSIEELDADDIRNIKKHKNRTNIKNFEYVGFE